MHDLGIGPYDPDPVIHFTDRPPTAREIVLFNYAREGHLDALFALLVMRADGNWSHDFFAQLEMPRLNRIVEQCYKALGVGSYLAWLQEAWDRVVDVPEPSRAEIAAKMQEFEEKSKSPVESPPASVAVETWMDFIRKKKAERDGQTS